MKKTVWISAIAFLAAVLVISACVPVSGGIQNSSQPTGVPQSSAQNDSGTILIGGAMCMTGPISFADIPELHGAQLAVDELNQKGGVLGRRLELRNLDCKNDPVTAASVTDQLVQQGARAIITSGTYWFGAPASREAQKAGLVGLSPTASSALFGSKTLGDKQFTLSMWNTNMGAAAAEYALKTRSWHNVYVITDPSVDYTKTLSRYFMEQYQKLGGHVINDDMITTAQTDFSPQVAHIQAAQAKPDFFFISFGMPSLSLLVHTLRAAGMDQPILGGDSYDDPALFKALGTGDGNEVYYVTHTFLAPGVTPDMAHFLDAYKGKYGQAPESNLAAPGWDAVMVLAQAMENAGSTDGAAMAKAMETNEFTLLTGKLSWSSAADGHQPDIEAAMVQVDHGVPKFIGWIRPADIPAP